MSEDRDNKTIWDWMRLSWSPDYNQIKFLGLALGIFAQFLAFLLALIALGLLVSFAVAVYAAVAAVTDVTGEAIRNIGLAVAAAFGAPFIAWRAMIAHRQTQVSEQGLASDRFLKANELLESENESIRIAALHILAELARTRQVDLDAATGVIVSRVRQLSSHPPVDFDDPIPEVRPNVASRATEDLSFAEVHLRDEAIKTWIASIPSPVQELRVALDLLGQIPRSKTRRLDFRDCNFQKATFSNGDFSKAMFAGARLDGARFEGTKLDETSFGGSRESVNYSSDRPSPKVYITGSATAFGALLVRARIRNSSFKGVVFENAAFVNCTVRNTDFTATSFIWTNFSHTQFENCFFFDVRFDYAWAPPSETFGPGNMYANTHFEEGQTDYLGNSIVEGRRWPSPEVARKEWRSSI